MAGPRTLRGLGPRRVGPGLRWTRTNVRIGLKTLFGPIEEIGLEVPGEPSQKRSIRPWRKRGSALINASRGNARTDTEMNITGKRRGGICPIRKEIISSRHPPEELGGSLSAQRSSMPLGTGPLQVEKRVEIDIQNPST
jgi:hypothetical protein